MMVDIKHAVHMSQLIIFLFLSLLFIKLFFKIANKQRNKQTFAYNCRYKNVEWRAEIRHPMR